MTCACQNAAQQILEIYKESLGPGTILHVNLASGEQELIPGEIRMTKVCCCSCRHIWLERMTIPSQNVPPQ